jgi:hypothetical protein
MIGDLDLYRGREQAYVKHFLLSEYVETWAHKVGSHWTVACPRWVIRFQC